MKLLFTAHFKNAKKLKLS